MAKKSPYFTRLNKNSITKLQTRLKRPKIKIEYDNLSAQQENLSVKQDNLILKKENSPVKQVNLSLKEKNSTEKQESLSLKEKNLHAKQENLSIKHNNLPLQKNSSGFEDTNLKKKEGAASFGPTNWEVILNNIKEMRKNRNAVVDSYGCERTADERESPEIKRYQTLISLMLSSQTKDGVTFAAMDRLKKHGLTIPSIFETSESVIEELIYPVGFWKRKAEFIKKATTICHDKFNNDIPNSLQGLLSLPGVGPKMAHICMNAAWGVVTGIGVDTHVHRIANRLKWVDTKKPEDTRKCLEAWLPRCEWDDINILLVGFGQQTCLPVGPKCISCLNCDICPSSTKNIR